MRRNVLIFLKEYYGPPQNLRIMPFYQACIILDFIPKHYILNLQIIIIPQLTFFPAERALTIHHCTLSKLAPPLSQKSATNFFDTIDTNAVAYIPGIRATTSQLFWNICSEFLAFIIKH